MPDTKSRPTRRFLLTAPILARTAAQGADWSPRRAADYLDARQKAWVAWPPALANGNGPCLSCHTGLPYLLARPALRTALGEKAPSPFEAGLLDALRRRLPLQSTAQFAPKEKEPLASQKLGVEAVLAALALASEDQRRGALSRETEQAFERLWALQIRDGDARGAWHWTSLELAPWEEPDSAFFGASLAALGAGIAPDNYQRRPDIRIQLEALRKYLRSRRHAQPLHNRLVLAWASMHLRDTLTGPERKSILEETLRKQSADGGWTTGSLGPWPAHPNAPPEQGSSAYATALASFILQRTGVPASHPGLRRALDWLRVKQDAEGGFWVAQSMNKQYKPGGIPILFMRDAASAFAALALLEAK